jgi:hypothetical protein
LDGGLGRLSLGGVGFMWAGGGGLITHHDE